MPDLTPALLPGLRSHRLSALDLGDEFVYPDYFGRSILNLPTSICTWLGVPELGAGPLHPDILAPLGDGYQNVILILMDALSLRRLTQLIAEGILPLWEKLADAGVLGETGRQDDETDEAGCGIDQPEEDTAASGELLRRTGTEERPHYQAQIEAGDVKQGALLHVLRTLR